MVSDGVFTYPFDHASEYNWIHVSRNAGDNSASKMMAAGICANFGGVIVLPITHLDSLAHSLAQLIFTQAVTQNAVIYLDG